VNAISTPFCVATWSVTLSSAGVLNADRAARADGVLVRQADFQRIADFRAGLSEAVIVGTIDVADEVQLLMEDAQRLAGHCCGGKN
jgi:hypothetical protein